MAETTLKTRFLHAYKTEAQWKALTTVPKSGEILYTKTGERDGWYKVGNGTDLWKDLPYIKPSYDYSEIQPLMSKHYENVYVTANNDPNGYIYFGVVKPTDYYAPWRITYRVNAKINGVTDGYEYSEVTIDGAKDTYYSYRTYNVIPNTSYRPYYYHLLRYAKQAGQLNGYGHQLGLRFHSSYDPSNETHSRIIDIEIIELVNCIFEFRDTMITYADVPGTGSTNYGGVSQFDAITNGQTIAGDRNTYNQLYMSSDRVFAGPNHIFPYTLIMKTDDGRWESIVTSYNSNPVKERNTHGFRPQQLVYYSGSSTINENSLTGGSTFFVSHYAVDTRYSFNTHATAGNEHNLDINKPVYLVGTISPTDELFYLSDPWLSQDLPTEDDGKLYMYVGESINVYQASLHPTHPIYHFKDGKVRQYIIHEATQAVAGLMSATDKKKLDGIEAGANKYTLPVASSSVIGGIKSGGDITVDANGSVTVNEATSLTTDKATSAGNRPVWISYAGNNKRAAYDTDFTYDAVNNTLHVQKIDGVELTGTPKAPTASTGTNSTQIATTAFVQNAVNNAVGDVEVGGRNLIKDSFRTISSTSYVLADYYFGDRPPLEGETITIQIKGQLASTKSYFGIYNSGGNVTVPGDGITAEDQDENGIYKKTYVWRVQSASNKYLRIYHMPSSVSNATSVIEWVKVERGTEPTDWTPAPEELVTSLSVSGRTITYKNYKGETLDSFTTQDTTYTAGTGITISGTTISNAYSEEKLKLSTELNTIALVDAFYETNYFKLGRATNYTTLTDITGRDGIVMSIPWVNTSYAQQVFFDIDDASKIYTRRKNSNGWGSWDRIVTESYGDSKYLPIKGNAVSATVANSLNAVHGNELFLGVNSPAYGTFWFNYRRAISGATSGNTPITDYYFGNGNANTTGVTIHADNFSGNANSATTAETASFLKYNDSLDYANAGVSWFNISGTAGAELAVNDTPTTQWWHILRFNHTNTNENYTDLAIPFNHEHLYYKRISGGTVSNGRWVQLVDDLNYETVIGEKFLKLSGGTLTGDLLFSDSGTTTRKIQGTVGSSDYWRIAGGATASNSSWMEIATADDGNEPIYARQYSGTFTTAKNTAILLDTDGSTSFPVSVTAPNLQANSYIRAKDTILNLVSDYTSINVDEIIIYTGLKWVASHYMPEIHITGNAYGSGCPIDLRLVFYIYGTKFCNMGVVDNGGWHPEVYLFKYAIDSVDYVAVGLKPSPHVYYPSIRVDFYNSSLAHLNDLTPSLAEIQFIKKDDPSVIPADDGGTTCILVPYKTVTNPIPKLTLQQNGGSTVAYDGTGTATFNVTKAGIGLGNVENKSSATIRGELTASNVTTALGYTPPAIINQNYTNNYSYLFNLGAYVGSSGAMKYVRIAIPELASWTMTYLEVSLKPYTSNVGYGGKVFIYAVHNGTSPYTWNQLTASILGYLPDDIKVFASDGRYFYIFMNRHYSTASVDRMLIGDSAATVNFSNVTIDFVDTLPETYQTATMYYGLHSGNFTSYLTDTYIPYSGSTISNPNTSSFSLANGITGNLIFANTGNTAGDWKGIGGINGANDAWVLRGYQTANNKGAVELAVGDDGDEGIYVRQYTSASYKIPLTNKPGANSGLNYREIELMAPSTGATTFPVSVKAPIIMAEEFRTANGGIPAVILCKPGLVSIADTKVDDPETNLTTSMDDDEWLKVLLKKICIEYPGKSHAIFKGVLSPNSQGYYEVYIYDTSTVNANTGLPQYAFGTWRHGPDIYWKFRTWGYTYSSQVILNDENYFTYALPLSGGTMTGTLTLKSNQYNDEGALSATAGTYALNLQNSNIIGVNAIFTSDVADDAREGINFYHTSTTVDSVWAKNGVLYFTPNRTLGTAGDTNNIILHSGNYMSYAVPYGGDDIGLGSGTPAEKAKEYFLDDSKVPKGTVKVFYNRSGSEFTTIFSKSSDGAYGNILKWGYGDLYLYKLRYSKGSWVGNDWQKIYAGYADSAGSATSSVKLSISSDLTTDTLDGFWENGYIKWARIRNYNIGLDSNDGLIINIPWDARYGAQLAIDESVTRMFMRNRSSNTWGAWHTFAHAQGKTGSTSQPVYMDSDGTLKVTTLTNSDISPIASKTYTGLYGSANDAANASFYFMSVKPNTYYVMWKIRYRIHCWVPGKNYYDSYSDVEIWGYQGSLSTNKIFNAHSYEGSSIRRCYYFHNLYRATQTGVSTYGHLIGLGLRASTNPTDSNYPRTFTIELLETENCECELWDEAVKYASVPGTGSTNYLGLSEINGADNGLQESSDANDTYTVRDYYTYLTAGANGMKQYSLVMEDDTGKWQSFTTTHGTATNKAKNTASFKLGNIYYMSTGSNYNSGQINGANIVTSHAIAIDFRYSTNCGTTLTANKPIFIVGTYNDATNTFTLDNTWWTQDYPTSEDNKIYIKIGYALNTYQIDFNNTLPMYWYKDGKVREFVIHEATPVSGGLMSASDKEKLDVLNIAEASMPAGSGKAVGWYRIAKISGISSSDGAGYANFTMYATGGYNSASPSVGIFELTTMHTFATITQTSALLNSIIKQIRLVGTSGEYYVDVYQNNEFTESQVMGQQTFSFIGRGTIETYNPETPLTGDDADATAAATLEIKNKAMAAENIYATRMYGNTLIQCDGTILSGTNSTTTNYTNISNGAIDVYGHTAQSRLLVTHNSTSKSSLYLYANTTNTRGIYTTNSAGTGKTVIGIDDSNNVTLYGNAETATNATTFTASVTVPTSRNYLLFQQDRSSNSGTVNARYHNSLSVTSNVSSSNSGTQWTELWIGNSTASGTAGNSQGWIGLYTSGSSTTQIAAYGTGNSNYFYIPNYAGSGYAVTAAGVSAVGSATKPVYLAANGRVTALDHDVVSAFSYGGAVDANTFYDTGIYNITGGKLTNAPNGYGYGQILTMSYRKLSGNTTPDYASQLYMHHGGNNTNRMFYRTSSSTEWQDWQMVAHGAASTAVGDTDTPVYMTNLGVITAVNQPKSGAWFQGVPYVDGSGIMDIGKIIDFHATTGATTDYDVRLTATTTELTVSKMLKVSGQIHSNGDIYSNGQLYAGVSANTSTKPNGSIHVHDIRKYKVLPSDFDQGANFYFAWTDSAVDVTMPTSGVWYSIMHVKGWTGDYSSWELAGPAHISDQRTTPLYVRAGRTTDDWGDWRKIYDESNPPAFTEIEGTLGVGKGGTGQTSAKNAANAFLNALDTGGSNPVDADYYISQYVGGGTTTTTYHRRPVSALYNYIKGKTDQVYIPLTGSSAVTGSISVRKASGEVQLAVGYTTEDTARWFYMYGNNTSGARGIYDSKKGLIVSVTDSSASFKGTADAITNFKVTTSANLGIASVSTNAIGYVNGLAADDWNYQRTDGALYTQFYSSSWQHEIFGDYRTGQISLRGKNNGTWQAWRRVLDESNYSTIISDNYLQKGGGTITGMVYANADLTVGFSTSTEKSHVTFSNSFNNYELVNTVNGDFALHDNTASHYVWRYAKSSYTQTTNAEITGRLLVDCCLGPTDVIATGYIEATGNIVTDGGDLISGRTTNSTRASVLLQNNAAGYRLCANTNGHCSLYAPDLGHNIFDFTPNGASSYIDFPYTVKATVQARSDVRLKENIKDTKINGLNAVNKMRLREYDWKADHKHQKVGLIADELEKIDEDLVSGGGYLDDGEMNAKCIDSYSLQMYMLKAIQELSQENKQLKEQLKTLMNRG